MHVKERRKAPHPPQSLHENATAATFTTQTHLTAVAQTIQYNTKKRHKMAEADIDKEMFAAAAEEVFADAQEGVEDMIMMESKGSVAVNAGAAEDAAPADIVAPSPTPPTKKRNKEDLPDHMGVDIAKRFKVGGETQVFFGKVDKKIDDDDMSVDWHVTYEVSCYKMISCSIIIVVSVVRRSSCGRYRIF